MSTAVLPLTPDTSLQRDVLRMSEQEYVSWAESTDARAEWVAGRVKISMSIDRVHDVLQTLIKAALMTIVSRRKLGNVHGDRFAMRLPHMPSRREPDVLFIANDNPAFYSRTVLEGACDLAIEIVSPSTIDDDYSEKFAEYQTARVREYWIVDPARQVIVAYHYDVAANQYVRVLADGEGKIHSNVVGGFWLQPSLLFRDPTPDPGELIQALGAL